MLLALFLFSCGPALLVLIYGTERRNRRQVVDGLLFSSSVCRIVISDGDGVPLLPFPTSYGTHYSKTDEGCYSIVALGRVGWQSFCFVCVFRIL